MCKLAFSSEPFDLRLPRGGQMVAESRVHSRLESLSEVGVTQCVPRQPDCRFFFSYVILRRFRLGAEQGSDYND